MKTPLYANTLIPAHVKTHLESTPIQGINSIFFQGHSKWTGLQRIYPAPWHNLGHMSLIFVHIRPCQNSHVPVLENSIIWSADSKPQISGSQASLHIRIIWEALKEKKKNKTTIQGSLKRLWFKWPGVPPGCWVFLFFFFLISTGNSHVQTSLETAA